MNESYDLIHEWNSNRDSKYRGGALSDNSMVSYIACVRDIQKTKMSRQWYICVSSFYVTFENERSATIICIVQDTVCNFAGAGKSPY